jgi:hypothetical protein
MKQLVIAMLCAFTVACGSSKETSPTSPTPNPNPTPTPTPTVTYTLSGRITENAFTPVPSATVAITDGANAGKTQTADPLGAYRLTDLAAGTFTLSVSATGYQTKTMSVNLARDTTMDVTMTPTSPH